MNKTTEFSFILKPAEYGVGVFTTHDITKGTFLRLFGNEDVFEERTRVLDEKSVPDNLKCYCIDMGDTLLCPPDFGEMPIGWHLNHSKNFNAEHTDYNWYASRDIKAGEEILIDYNSLGEPESEKESYYND